jgi:hypothetical protein
LEESHAPIVGPCPCRASRPRWRGRGVHRGFRHGASVTEVECGILLPGILPEGQVIATTGRLIVTPSGTATLVCHGRLDRALAPAKTIIFTDIPCALGEGGTVGESRPVVRPNRRVTLTCHNNPGSEPLPPGED